MAPALTFDQAAPAPDLAEPLGNDLADIFTLELDPAATAALAVVVNTAAGQVAGLPTTSGVDSSAGGGAGGGPTAAAGLSVGSAGPVQTSAGLPGDQSALEAMVTQPSFTVLSATSAGLADTPQAPLATTVPAAPTSNRPTPQQRVQPDFGRIPLVFEPNVGQVDGHGVEFLSQGQGYTLYLTNSSEAVLFLARPGPARSSADELELLDPEGPGGPAGRDVLRMRLVGASGTGRVSGEQELTSRSNYFVGPDPSRWRTDVPNYPRGL